MQPMLARLLDLWLNHIMAVNSSSKPEGIKKVAAQMVKDLPITASWDDLMYAIYVRQKIDAGLNDIRAGKTHSHESVVQRFADAG